MLIAILPANPNMLCDLRLFHRFLLPLRSGTIMLQHGMMTRGNKAPKYTVAFGFSGRSYDPYHISSLVKKVHDIQTLERPAKAAISFYYLLLVSSKMAMEAVRRL